MHPSLSETDYVSQSASGYPVCIVSICVKYFFILDSDEVELIPPVKTRPSNIDEGDSDPGFVPILVIRQSRFPSIFENQSPFK